MHRAALLVLLIAVTFAPQLHAGDELPPKSLFQPKDRVVLLGGTFFEREQRYGYLEEALTDGRFPLTFRNLGWSGDTVWAESRGIFDAPDQGYARMLQQLQELKPTVVVLNYGANESFAGEPGLPNFLQQLEKLTADIEKLGARIVVVTPHPFWKLSAPLPDPEPQNRKLKLYSQALKDFAAKHQFPVIDLNPLTFADVPAETVTHNSLHLTGEGYWLFAEAIRKQFYPASQLIIARDAVQNSSGVQTRNLSVGKDQLKLELQRTQLPLPPSPARQQRSGLISVSLDGLAPGTWELLIDGKSAGRHSAADWQEGQQISLPGDEEQADKVRQLILEKNELYFHRWRPQNVTYLFLFRKHEQGQNAKEIPMFDPLVEQKEAEIDKLKQPAWHQLEWRRVGRPAG